MRSIASMDRSSDRRHLVGAQRDTLLRDQTAAMHMRNVIVQVWNQAQARGARLRISSITQPGISSATTEPGQNKTTADDSEAEGSANEIDLD
ncbi:hypothetical protein [Nocardia sp. NPDC059239]|uniref:hypothetical protein n=1 Tax=unclassified Nocardia TaxID=2637762 RepID=UPI00367646F2